MFTQAPAPGADAIGIFSGSTDVGTPSTIGAGRARFDPATKVYTIAGGGENMWAAADHFRYVWKKVSGDVALEASIEFVATTPETGAPGPAPQSVPRSSGRASTRTRSMPTPPSMATD